MILFRITSGYDVVFIYQSLEAALGCDSVLAALSSDDLDSVEKYWSGVYRTSLS